MAAASKCMPRASSARAPIRCRGYRRICGRGEKAGGVGLTQAYPPAFFQSEAVQGLLNKRIRGIAEKLASMMIDHIWRILLKTDHDVSALAETTGRKLQVKYCDVEVVCKHSS